MEIWEEAGLTEEEYDQAMADMDEALGLSEPPSEADMMGMHMQYVLDEVIPAGRDRPYTAEEWDHISTALEEADEMQTEHPDDMAMQFVQPLSDFAREQGFDSERDGSVHDWAAKRAAQLSSAEGALFEDEGAMPERIEDVPFDKMLDWHIEHDKPWSKAMGKMLNDKVVQERDDIEQSAYEQAMASDDLHAQADAMDFVRERDGIVGNEPDIPWYEARDHAFGEPVEDMHVRADEMGEQAGRDYTDAMNDLYCRVYDYGARRFDDIPETVRGELQNSDFAVTQATYRELGEGYEEFYREQLQDYTDRRQHEVAGMGGIDLTRSTQQAPVPAPEAEKQAAKAPAKAPGRGMDISDKLAAAERRLTVKQAEGTEADKAFGGDD